MLCWGHQQSQLGGYQGTSAICSTRHLDHFTSAKLELSRQRNRPLSSRFEYNNHAGLHWSLAGARVGDITTYPEESALAISRSCWSVGGRTFHLRRWSRKHAVDSSPNGFVWDASEEIQDLSGMAKRKRAPMISSPWPLEKTRRYVTADKRLNVCIHRNPIIHPPSSLHSSSVIARVMLNRELDRYVACSGMNNPRRDHHARPDTPTGDVVQKITLASLSLCLGRGLQEKALQGLR